MDEDNGSQAQGCGDVPARAERLDPVRVLSGEVQRLRAASGTMPNGTWRPGSTSETLLRKSQPWLVKKAVHIRAQWTLARKAVSGGGEARDVIARSIDRRVARLLGREPKQLPILRDTWARYPAWLQRYDTLQTEDRVAIAARIAAGLPRIGVLVYFGETHPSGANRVAAAIDQQLFAPAFVTVLLAGTATAETEVAARAAFGDARVGRGVAPDLEASADCILVMDASHILRPHATVAFACAMAGQAASMIYSDEDQLTATGELDRPFFKPAFSPRFAESGYMGSCALIARQVMPLAMLSESLQSSMDGVRDVLRTVARGLQSNAVAHIPMPLTVETRPKPLGPTAPAPRMASGSEPGPLKASIIIPSRNRLELLQPCVESILAGTHFDRTAYEIIVVNNDSDDPATLDYLRNGIERGDFSVIDDQEPFNYSRLNNLAVASARGKIVVFLNNDTLVIQPDWLTRLVDEASVTDVGAVGVKLLYPDGTVQHAGVVLGVTGVAGHGHLSIGEAEPGYHGLANADREVSAVTGACMAMRKQVFETLRGFDPAFPIAYNDIMLCIAALEHGYRNIVLNSVKLIHLESKSRGRNDTPEKIEVFMREATQARSAANHVFRNDTYYNSNLSLDEPYGLAEPPRRCKPWFKLRDKPSRILLLSADLETCTGVVALVREQVRYLTEHGYIVYLGGPSGSLDLHDLEYQYVPLSDPQSAAIFACRNNIDCIVAHTPPFYSTSRWLGATIPAIAVDHGSPPPHLFADAETRQAILMEKRFAFATAARVCAISQSVKLESGLSSARTFSGANSHFPAWDDDAAILRTQTRAEQNWTRTIVVLNVCDFGETVRHLNGVDTYVELAGKLRRRLDARNLDIAFVLAGRTGSGDVAVLRQQGLDVRVILNSAHMASLYAAADIYVNFSRWEGYGLGIAQAFAMGLPIIASDIPAHRMNVSVPLVSRPEQAIPLLLKHARHIADAGFAIDRRSQVTSWEPALALLEEEITLACATAASQADNDQNRRQNPHLTTAGR